jgi:thioredoxin 1
MNEASDNKNGKACACGAGGSCGGSCGKPWILLALILLAALATAVAVKNKRAAATAAPPQAVVSPPADVSSAIVIETNGLPWLVDLGATKCMACKMMAPVLDGLRTSFSNDLNVVFIDVWDKPAAGEAYGIRMIPTQVFYGADGKELFRHEGFISREDILAKWKELGVEFKDKPAPAS